MGRLHPVLTSVALAAAVCGAWPSAALAQPAPARVPVLQTARASVAGAITGVVSDEQGGPVAGAMVSVMGATMAMDVTDAQGRFAIQQLPSGEYVLAAHRQGFAAARRQIVRVGAGALPGYRLELRRLDGSVATAASTVESRPILAAGFDLPRVDPAEAGDGKESHPHTEIAWRLRHLPRSILKDSASTIAVTDSDAVEAESLFGRAMDSAARMAGAAVSIAR